MSELYAGLIAAGLFIAGAIASYLKGKKIAEDKAELKAALKEKTELEVEIDRNAKHKKIDESVGTLSDDDVNRGLRFIFGKDKRR